MDGFDKRRAPARGWALCGLLFGAALSACSGGDHQNGNATLPAPKITFSAAAGEAVPGATLPFAWNVSDASDCTASGGTGSSGWSGALPTSGYAMVTLPVTAGTYTYVLSCNNGDQTSSMDVTVKVADRVAGPGITLTPATQTMQAGGTATRISWSAPTAVQCTGSGNDPAWTGSKALNGGYTPAPTTAGTYLYTLSCTNAQGGLNLASSIVIVTQAGPALTIALSSPKIQAGGSSTLSWTASGATQCSALGDDPAWTATTPSKSGGSFAIGGLAAGAYTYTLSCRDASGASNEASAVLSVGALPPPSFGSFSGVTGNPTTLSWDFGGASLCTAYSGNVPAWTGSRDASGSESVSLDGARLAADGSALYTLVCEGSGGKTSASTVMPASGSAAPTGTLAATPSQIAPGSAFTLNWAADGASICTASGGDGSTWSGNKAGTGAQTLVAPTAPGLYTYRLACAAGAGSDSSQTEVYVTVGDARPTLELSVNDAASAALNAGDALTLKWSARNAVFCSAQGGIANRGGWSGTQPLGSEGLSISTAGLDGHYDFALRCGVPGGESVVKLVGVDVTGDADQCGIGSHSLLLTGAGVEAPWRRVTNVAVKIRSSVGETPVGIISAGDGSEVIDADLDTYTQLLLPLDLFGIGNIVVDVYSTEQNEDGSIRPLPIRKGQRAGFIVSNPNQALSLSLLGLDSLAPITGVDADGQVTPGALDYSNANGLQLDALYLVNDGGKSFVSFPLDDATVDAGVYGIRYKMKGGLIAVAKMLNVYGACVTNQD